MISEQHAPKNLTLNKSTLIINNINVNNKIKNILHAPSGCNSVVTLPKRKKEQFPSIFSSSILIICISPFPLCIAQNS